MLYYNICFSRIVFVMQYLVYRCYIIIIIKIFFQKINSTSEKRKIINFKTNDPLYHNIIICNHCIGCYYFMCRFFNIMKNLYYRKFSKFLFKLYDYENCKLTMRIKILYMSYYKLILFYGIFLKQFSITLLLKLYRYSTFNMCPHFSTNYHYIL